MSAKTTKRRRISSKVRAVEAEMKSRGWKREDLAYHSGLSFRTLEEISAGRRPLTLASAVKIARAFGWDYERIAPEAKS
jgi:plasmid maintenance system antidote protein VapI